MTNHKLKLTIEKVVILAKLAGEAILEIYNSDEFGIETKDDESPLTKADKAANKIICDGLSILTPDIPIISEENKEIPYSTRKDYEYVWMVDPLDGTKEFIKKNGEFTVNIALIHKQEAIASVVYIPVADLMYYAIKGVGAYRKIEDRRKRLTVNDYQSTDKNLRVVCSRSHLNASTQTFVDKLNTPELISVGSSLKFIIIAEGNAEIYPRLAPTMEWDTAAAHVILREAGGNIYQADTLEPVIYNKENLLNPHFIATANEQKP